MIGTEDGGTARGGPEVRRREQRGSLSEADRFDLIPGHVDAALDPDFYRDFVSPEAEFLASQLGPSFYSNPDGIGVAAGGSDAIGVLHGYQGVALRLARAGLSHRKPELSRGLVAG